MTDDMYCNANLIDGSQCGRFSLNVFYPDLSDKCYNHIYLDGKEVVAEFEELRK